jgi:hypothetical protein
MLVCKYYQLLKHGKEFQLKHKELLRSRIIVTEEQVKENNDIYLQTGRWYDVDEEATEQRNAEQKVKQAAYYEAKKLQVEGAATLAKAVQGITASALKPKPKAPVIVEASDELKAVQQRAKEAGVKSPHLYKSIDTLEAKILEVEPLKTSE